MTAITTTTARIDYPTAGTDECRGHSRVRIAAADRLNRIDACVAAEACRRAGVTLTRCEIDYYGDQTAAGTVAFVRVRGVRGMCRIVLTAEMVA
jgi:hypothetical protein